MNRHPFGDLETIGVVAVNSVGYVEAMLSHLRSGVVSVPLQSADDEARKERTGTGRVVVPSPRSGWVGMPFASEPGDDPAMISFSSGTEGPPKAVLLSRGNLHDVVVRLADCMELTGEIREYVGVPVYHSFGYARCRAVLNAGGDCYIPGRGFDLTEIRRMLRDGEINAVSAVPSQWRVFLQNLDLFGEELGNVRWVEIGSQYMSAEEKRALRETLPGARIVQHYGLTEASRTTLLRVHAEPPEALESLGRCEGAVQIRIGDRGRIEIRGPHVAIGIDDGASYRALSRDDWLETSDLGRIEDGLLYFLGRADEVINCSGIKLAPDLIETHVRRRVSDAGDFGILRCPDPLRGDGVLVALAPDAIDSQERILESVREYTRAQGLDAAGAIVARPVPELPRTATGKLRRRALTDLLAKLPENPTAPGPARAGRREPGEAAPTGSGFAAQLGTLFAASGWDPGRTFLEVGGDSLSHMQMTLALERALGEAPPHWEAIPLGDLVERAEVASLLGEAAGGPASRTPPLPAGDRNMNPVGLPFWALIREDYLTNDASVFHQGFLMLLVHRFGNWRMGVRWRLARAPLSLAYRVLNKMTQIFFGMKLDYTVKVGRRVKLEHFGGMILGAREIGDDVVLRQNTTIGIRSTEDLLAKPVIGDFVDVGAGAVIVGQITIGENSVIGANSVVYMNIPPDSVVVGVPGRVIGTNPRRNPSPLRARPSGRGPDAGPEGGDR